MLYLAYKTYTLQYIMKTNKKSNESMVLEVFHRNKTMTINELKLLLQRSVRTVHARLKNWKAISSYNKNSAYYTLPSIAKFDKNGLWHYKEIRFSKHGNLRQAMIYIVKTSEKGLYAHDIGELLGLDTRSFLSHFSNIPEFRREKITGHYVYFSNEDEIYKNQRTTRVKEDEMVLISPLKDSAGISVLVERIKFPDLDTNSLSVQLRKKGIRIKPEAIENFFYFHGIEKKTKGFA